MGKIVAGLIGVLMVILLIGCGNQASSIRPNVDISGGSEMKMKTATEEVVVVNEGNDDVNVEEESVDVDAEDVEEVAEEEDFDEDEDIKKRGKSAEAHKRRDEMKAEKGIKPNKK